jgi:hypothetical protein
VRKPHYEFSLSRAGTRLEWEDHANRYGGRFCIFFTANTIAIRTYCLLCHDWLTAEFPFAERIVGVLFSVKPPHSWGC